jgi:serine/threonine protein kinase
VGRQRSATVFVKQLLMPLSPGDRLGPYEITTPVGAGGMGEVHRARDGKLNRSVAIKVLPAALAESPEFRDQEGGTSIGGDYDTCQ